MYLLNCFKVMSILYLSMIHKGHKPTFHLYAHVVFDNTSVADSYNPDEPDPDNLCNQALLKMNKLAYIFGPKQAPICATRLSHKKLRSKQCYHLLHEFGYSILIHNLSSFTIDNLLESFIFGANDYEYSRFLSETFVTAFHPFLKHQF